MGFLDIYKGKEFVGQALVDDHLEAKIKRRLGRSKAKLRFKGQYPVARLGWKTHTKKDVPLHYIVWKAAGRSMPRRGEMIDHINQDLKDNRIGNLKIVDASERQANSPKHRDNKTGFKGVSKTNDGSFQSQVGKDRANHYLGKYDSAHAAAHAVNHGYSIMFPKVPIPNRLAEDDLTLAQRREIEQNVERLLHRN